MIGITSLGTVGRSIGHPDDHAAVANVLLDVKYRLNTRTGTHVCTGRGNTDNEGIALNVDRSTVGIWDRGQRCQIELLNYNANRPVELVSITVAADVLDHYGD